MDPVLPAGESGCLPPTPTGVDPYLCAQAAAACAVACAIAAVELDEDIPSLSPPTPYIEDMDDMLDWFVCAVVEVTPPALLVLKPLSWALLLHWRSGFVPTVWEP